MLKALIVDDSKMIRTAIRRILTGMDIEANEADNVQVALDFLRDAGSPELVLLTSICRSWTD